MPEPAVKQMTGTGTLEATQVFTWDVLPEALAAPAACGTSEHRGHAIGALLEALRLTPKGTRGVIKTATISAVGDIAYTYGPVVVEAHRETADSVTVWLR
jgi:hypothetical protein